MNKLKAVDMLPEGKSHIPGDTCSETDKSSFSKYIQVIYS